MNNNLIFPKEFDLLIYKDLNKHLSHLSDDELISHYNNYGYQEGLFCNNIRNRNDFLNIIKLINPKTSVEIGALHCSLLKVAGINNVKIIDYFTTDELKENYKDHLNINTNNIVNVDYAVKNIKIYSDIISERFDICFSSHNIEHMPCMITYLNNVSSILHKDAYFFLLIPDYRYCFDRYKNPSTIFDILYKYYNKAEMPCCLNILDSRFNGTINDTTIHWDDTNILLNQNGYYDHINKKNKFYESKKNEIIDNINYIKDIILNNKEYIDSHCWKFTPESFSFIMDILYKIKLTDLKLIRCYKTLKNTNEFNIILQKI
jgi:hypothetical protein